MLVIMSRVLGRGTYRRRLPGLWEMQVLDLATLQVARQVESSGRANRGRKEKGERNEERGKETALIMNTLTKGRRGT